MRVAPSILSADFINLKSQIDMINESDAFCLHVDVMDGNFVPNISIGFPTIKAVGKISQKPLDVHMMVNEPGRFISQVRDCGAALMNVHYEACTHLNRTLTQIREAGMKVGVTINPATPVSLLEDVVDMVDLVLIMSVNPGFGGQKFIENSINKVERLRSMIDAHGASALIEVDGGVNDVTGAALAKVGADILVAGNYVFSAPNPLTAINTLINL
jgi:ribulose-phosphate 3-epimerase